MIRILVALTLLAGSAEAQIAGEAHRYTVGDMEFEGYVARNPALAESRGTVVIVHDWDGLDAYERQRAEMVAALGYTAFAVDVYGADHRPQTVEENQQFMMELFNDRELFRERLLGSLAEARAVAGEGGLVLMGYCFGGAATLEAARAGAEANGFVSFHGALMTPEGQDYSKTTAPILVLQGAADPLSGPAGVAELVTELEAAGVPNETQIYGGARHAYTVWGGGDYDLNADRESWAALERFLDEAL